LLRDFSELGDQLLEQIREPLQKVHDAVGDGGRIGFWARMFFLRFAEFAMAVSTDDHQFIAKLAPGDVVEFQAARIILATNHASWCVGPKSFKLHLPATLSLQEIFVHCIFPC
jgi:hypothetical protein